MFSSINFYFWGILDRGYFAQGNDGIPTLHLWSLAVEEQFYFVWPFLLLFLNNFLSKRQSMVTLIGLTLITLFGTEIYLYFGEEEAKNFSYFMLPTRIYELLIGALTFFATRRYASALDRPWLVWVLAPLGLALMILPLFLLSGVSRFPGMNAAIPCLGAALTIFSGLSTKNLISRILATRLFVHFGLLSYSLYLWHWPILCFMKYFSPNLSWQEITFAFSTTYLLSLCSYHFIERPLRQMRLANSKVFT